MIRKPHKSSLHTNSIYMSTSGPNGETVSIQVGFTKEGFTCIWCDCDVYSRKGWCHHILNIYADKYADRRLPSEKAPLVDIFIREPLLVPVVLSEDINGMNAVHVMWGNPRKVNDEFISEGGEVIAFIKDVTRQNLRREILDWLPAKIYEVEHCQASSHSPGDSILDSLTVMQDYQNFNETLRRNYIRDVWSLLDSQQCVSCAKVMDEMF